MRVNDNLDDVKYIKENGNWYVKYPIAGKVSVNAIENAYLNKSLYKVQYAPGTNLWALFDDLKKDFVSDWGEHSSIEIWEKRLLGPGREFREMTHDLACEMIEEKLEQNFER